jgi:hypothetical protein
LSFGWAATTWVAISAGASAAVSIYGADQQRKASNTANDQAVAQAKKNQQLSDEANNRANAKAPDSAAAMAASVLAGKSGQSGTMLTGPQGIDPTQLTLGKQTLLGGGG